MGLSPAEDDDRAADTAASTVRLFRFCALAIANLKLPSALVFSRCGSSQPPPQIKG